jgi:hypothetical protein
LLSAKNLNIQTSSLCFIRFYGTTLNHPSCAVTSNNISTEVYMAKLILLQILLLWEQYFSIIVYCNGILGYKFIGNSIECKVQNEILGICI